MNLLQTLLPPRVAATLTVWVVMHLVAVTPAAQDVLRPEPITSDEPSVVLYARTGWQWLDDDHFALIEPGMQLTFRDLSLGRDARAFGGGPLRFDLEIDLQAPLRLRFVDRAPSDDGVLRRDDWNEPAEYLRWLSRIELGTPWGPLYLRTGDLANVRVGHGSQVDRVLNNLDMDHFRWGLHTAVNATRAGGTLMLDDVTRPTLFSTRLWASPWAGTEAAATLRSLAFGVTVTGDPSAPRALAADPDGALLLDGRGRYIGLNEGFTGMLGFDLEAVVVRSERFRLTLYQDVNIHLTRGTGWHVGGSAGWAVSPTTVIELRGELRVAGRGYAPGFFHGVYGASRYQAQAPGATAPLRTFMAPHTTTLRTGYLVELGIWSSRALELSWTMTGGSGAWDESMSLRIATPRGLPVHGALLWHLPLAESWSRARVMERALAIAEVQVPVLDWLVVWANAGRRFRSTAEPFYLPTHDYGAGVSFVWGNR